MRQILSVFACFNSQYSGTFVSKTSNFGDLENSGIPGNPD